MDDKSAAKYFILVSVSVIIISIGYSYLKLDDAFIFYTYAKNISLGKGFVFNSGERLNAATSPLYTLLTAFFNFLTGPDNIDKIPLIGNLIGFISLWFLSYYSYRIVKVSGLKKACYIFPFLILANPILKNSVGMETYLALLLSILTIYFYLKDKFNLSALFGAFAVLARYDNLLLILIIFVLYFFKYKKLPGFKVFFIFWGSLLPWFVFSYFYFGNLLPATLKIKMIQGSLGFWGKGLLFIKGFTTAFPGKEFSFFILLILFISGFISILLKNNKLFRKDVFIIILLWACLYFICYGFILNPPSYPWYYTFFIIPVGLVISFAIEDFFEKISEKYLRYFLFSLFIFSLILPIRTYFKPNTSKYQVYKEAAKWLNINSRGGSSVMIDEIGVLGFYYNKGKVIDLLGLANPESVSFLEQKNYLGIVDYYKPEYLIVDYPQRQVYEDFIKYGKFLNSYSIATIISAKGKSVEIFHSNAED